MKSIISLLLLLLFSTSLFSQKKVLDVAGIDLRIVHSINENGRQQTVLNNQTSNTAVEEVNKSQTKKYKEKAKEIQERLNKLSILLDVYKVGQEGVKITNNIKNQQSYIIAEITKSPYLIFLQINQIQEMATQVELLGRYLAGSILTGADIYAMENSDRKVITTFILDELRAIEFTSWQMYATISRVRMNQKLNANAFKNWINKDKQVVKEIIENAKKL
ncbi:MAG: hypothetical protein LBT43_06050 [Prevotella sp.]|jgi:hypothetical protein|nr:hypothetical protein [Prevotella sp.]